MLKALLKICRSKGEGKAVSEKLIRKAFEVSCKAHYGQFRKSMEPYFYHPYEVAKIAAEYGCDSKTIAGCLLHDALEDTLLSGPELKKSFGKEIADMVVGLTKFGIKENICRDEKQKEYLRRALEFSVRDPRVIIIKLFDKLHNSRTAIFLGKKKRLAFVREVWECYVPLAHRLGIHKLRYELEDAVLEMLKPKEFPRLKKEILGMRKQKEKEIRKMIRILKPELKGCEFLPYWKGFGSIYAKIIAGKKRASSIYDPAILLILTNSGAECYKALGILHKNFRPLPFKFKDFIAMPEFRVYQSLHSVVIGPDGKPVKVYIRSRQMDDLANRGIISLIGAGRGKPKGLLEGKINWMKSLLGEDRNDFGHVIGMDHFSARTFVYSPKGEVVDLPAGATCLDFAYAIHSDLGRRARFALADGRKIPLKSPLSNASTVEIIASKNAKPRKEMLSWVVTLKAKREIRKALESAEKERLLGIRGKRKSQVKGKKQRNLKKKG